MTLYRTSTVRLSERGTPRDLLFRGLAGFSVPPHGVISILQHIKTVVNITNVTTLPNLNNVAVQGII